MRIGIFLVGVGTVQRVLERIIEAEEQGFDSIWFGQLFGPDVLTVMAMAGQRTQRVELGTSVVPVHIRHPFFLAQQALTVQGATGGRLSLGIGPSHRVVVEGAWGLSYDRATAFMREYTTVLRSLVHEGRVNFQGEFFRVNASVQVPEVSPMPILVSALGPLMLRMAGEVADGTITWMVGPRTLEKHVIPTIRRAAAAAGRPEPRICAGFPVAVTDDPETTRQRAARALQSYMEFPSYRRMLEMEGAEGPQDVSIIGNEAEVERQIRAIRDMGVSDFLAAPMRAGDEDRESLVRTRQLLTSLAGKL
jgi:F420-dependent oxidoreductase-like protein